MLDTGFKFFDYIMNPFESMKSKLHHSAMERTGVALDSNFRNLLAYTSAGIFYMENEGEGNYDEISDLSLKMKKLVTSIPPLINTSESNTYPLGIDEFLAIEKAQEIIEKFSWATIMANKFKIMNSAVLSLDHTMDYLELSIENNQPIKIGFTTNHMIVDTVTSIELLHMEDGKDYKDLLTSVKRIRDEFKKVIMNKDNEENLFILSTEKINVLKQARKFINSYLYS